VPYFAIVDQVASPLCMSSRGPRSRAAIEAASDLFRGEAHARCERWCGFHRETLPLAMDSQKRTESRWFRSLRDVVDELEIRAESGEISSDRPT
jgi:hypothetical protein